MGLRRGPCGGHGTEAHVRRERDGGTRVGAARAGPPPQRHRSGSSPEASGDERWSHPKNNRGRQGEKGKEKKKEEKKQSWGSADEDDVDAAAEGNALEGLLEDKDGDSDVTDVGDVPAGAGNATEPLGTLHPVQEEENEGGSQERGRTKPQEGGQTTSTDEDSDEAARRGTTKM